ncbi:MAG: folate-binding protein [Alphaproteobacteria bacterium]|nr:folate-binding protein [Alphaproteobacteria bacterium]
MSNRYVLLPHRTVLRLRGKDMREFLQGLITQDITKVTSQHSIWTAMLSAQGKYLFDFFVAVEGDSLLLDCDIDQAPQLMRLLTMYKLRADVHIENLGEEYHVLAAMGDVSALALPTDAGRTEYFADAHVTAFIDPRHAAMKARIIAPAGEGETWIIQRGYAQACVSDYETLRIQHAIPRAGVDSIPQKTLILENGFEALNGVSFEKGCYVGQEVTARTKHRAKLHKQLYQVQSKTALPAAGCDITLEGRVVGEMRSSLALQGLAILRNDAVEKSRSTAHSLLADGHDLTAINPPWQRA